jgi:hypothetical protein
MHDPNQIEVPASFLALFTSPYGQKLTEPIATVRERSELCEDLAQMLTERAGASQFQTDGSEREVLLKMRAALTEEGSPVQPNEAVWISRRLAELLGWEDPGQE